MLSSKPESCRQCPQWNDGVGFCQTEGCGASNLLIVGEASGSNERNDGLPFRPFAEAGIVLQKAFSLVGRPRSEHTITNILRCQPGRMEGGRFVGVNEMGPQADEAIACCRQHLDRVVEVAKPRCILALGNVPLRALTSFDGEVGHKQSVTQVRGFILHSERYNLPVVASYHPSFLRHGAMHLFGALRRDLRLALLVAAKGAPAKPVVNYLLYPSEAEARAFAATVTPDAVLGYDIETRDSTAEEEEDVEWGDTEITQIQFSLAPGTGIVMPWVEPFIGVAREILAKPCHKLDFNGWEYDLKVLASKGVTVHGWTEDLRWCWHHLQPDLPGKAHKGGLQYVTSFACPEFGPWKHTYSADLATYGAADVDVLHRVRDWCYGQLREKGLLQAYLRQVLRLRQTLVQASDRGICLDREAQAAFRTVAEREMAVAFERMQATVPDELKSCLPREGYKSDKIADKARAKALAPGEKWVRRSFVESNKIADDASEEDVFGETLFDWVRPSFAGVAPSTSPAITVPQFGCTETDIREKVASGVMERWCRLQPFVPSKKQLTAYIRHRGHKVPKIPGDNMETTGKLGIQRLFAKTREPLYADVLTYREAETIASKYLWPCGPDGRVHTTFTFRPATGQLAAIKPPVMTIPKRTAMADAVRRTIRATPGHTLVSFDYMGFHFLTMGFEAGDTQYMRVARIDLHSFITATQILKVENHAELLALDDDDLKVRLNFWKADRERVFPTSDGSRTFKWIRDFRTKPAALGYQLGLQAKHLYESNLESFGSQKEAQAVIDAIDRAFPRVCAYRKRQRDEAAKRKHLKSRFGYIRWFWDDRGKDGEAAGSFCVQNDAHGHFKQTMGLLDDAGYMEKYWFILPVHDDLTFDCPNDLVQECIRNVVPVMERHSDVLIDSIVAPDGLWCGVETKTGPNLAEMKEFR